MIETPRTDAEDINILEQEGFVKADFARELERELHQAKAQRDNILLIAHNLKEAIESTFKASKDPFNTDSSYEYIETHGWTHEILNFARGEIKKLEQF